MNFTYFWIFNTYLDLEGIFLVFQFFKTVLESTQELLKGQFSEDFFITHSVTLGYWRQQSNNRRQTTMER